MKVSGGRGCDIIWEAYDENDDEWFNARFSLYDFGALKTSDKDVSDRLTHLFNKACNLNSDFLSTWKGMKVQTRINFPRKYGWGTSSTLISLIAQWADIDPLDLMKMVTKGSGYDVACAQADGPIVYQLADKKEPIYNQVDWEPDFIDNLYLIYQERKADSQAAVEKYLQQKSPQKWISKIDALTSQFLNAENLRIYEEIIEEHERLIAERLHLTPIKKEHFSDFWGSVKSLGAWGGDFALVSSDRSPAATKNYFAQKGYSTFFNLKSVLYSKETTPA